MWISPQGPDHPSLCLVRRNFNIKYLYTKGQYLCVGSPYSKCKLCWNSCFSSGKRLQSYSGVKNSSPFPMRFPVPLAVWAFKPAFLCVMYHVSCNPRGSRRQQILHELNIWKSVSVWGDKWEDWDLNPVLPSALRLLQLLSVCLLDHCHLSALMMPSAWLGHCPSMDTDWLIGYFLRDF